MWRIRHSDDRLSDMVNLNGARDAGRIIALGILNRGKRGLSGGISEPDTAHALNPETGTEAHSEPGRMMATL